jgi:hypothetical protein
MIELFVENQRLDVNEIFSTILSLAIDDIKDFGSKETTFSKTIILPGTKLNNKFLGNIFDVTVANGYNSANANFGTNFNAAVSARAYIFNGNIQCFKGVMRLMAVNIYNGIIDYEVSVVGELGGFISDRGNKKLEELDFSSHDHVYSIANILASWNNANGGSGYYYPLIDYGDYSALKANWKLKTFRPALFAKEYIDKIFAASGYTYDSALFNTTRFKGIGVPHNQKTLTKQGNELIVAAIDTDVNAPLEGFLEFETLSSTDFTLSSDRLTYTSANSIIISLAFTLSGHYAMSNDAVGFRVSLRKNAVVIAFTDFLSNNFVDENYTVAFNESIDLVQNDIIDIRYDLIDALVPTFYTNEIYSASLVATGNSTTLVNVNLGDDVLVNDTIPKNILQLDFVSSIIKLFNLYVFESATDDKVLLIKPFVDFYADAEVDDWTLKVDRESNINIKPMSELNARYYEFKYKDDSDFYNDQYKKRYNISYGSFLYDSQFEFSKEKESVELIFSPTPLVGYSSEDKIFSTIFKKSGLVEEQIDSNIRLLQFKKITGVASYNILADNGTTVLSTQTAYSYAGHFDDPDAPANDLNFGVPQELFYILGSGALNVNQFNVYWSPYMAEITDKDSKLMTFKAKLSYKDIYNFDFSRLKWVDGALFRVNRIDNFNATREDLCDVQLLKVINKIY